MTQIRMDILIFIALQIGDILVLLSGSLHSKIGDKFKVEIYMFKVYL